MSYDIQITDRDLPVLSAVASQALQLLQDPNITNRKIEELIRQDMALTQRVLSHANSPFYSGRRSSQTISEAVLRLGLRQLRNVIVVAATGELFSGDDPCAQTMWAHSLNTAMAASTLADVWHTTHTEESFIAGMLHDVGQIIIYNQHPAIYREVMERATTENVALHKMEEQVFQYFTHPSVGGLVIRKWKLSENIAEAARFHHEVEADLPSALTNVTLTCLVSLASLIAHGLYEGQEFSAATLAPFACLKALKLTPEQVDRGIERVAEIFQQQNRPAVAQAG